MGVLLAAQPVSKFAVSFSVPGPVVGKGRPRFGKGRIFTPLATVRYENLVAHEAMLAMRGEAPFAGAVRALVTAYMPIPASYSKRKREGCLAGLLWPTGKPDADNVLKVLDALNGIVWKDDSQVVDARIIKVWGGGPGLSIQIEEL
jgi:Holliday junction resolvase RusA-like endonuclease